MTMKQSDRSRIVRQIHEATKRRVGKGKLHRSCMWYAFETIRILDSYSIRAVLQAGSASWKVVPDENDDGIKPTHYSYVCESLTSRDIMVMMTEGVLPELHVWAAIPSTNEVIDLTTRFLPRLCKESGIELELKYPAYLWEDVKRLSETGVYYEPNRNATLLLMHIIMEKLQ